MQLNLDFSMILYFVLGLVVLYVFSWIFFAPLRIIGKLVLNAMLGAVLIVALGWIGGPFTLALNPISAMVVGVLGIPGVIVLYLIKFLL